MNSTRVSGRCAVMRSASARPFMPGMITSVSSRSISSANVPLSAAPNLCVVVSAMNGVTDLLLDAGQAALRGDRARCETAVAEFESRHLDLIGELIGSRDAAERLRRSLAAAAHEMISMTESIAVLKELTTRTQDVLVARGERAVAELFTAALEENGLAAAYV